MEPSSTSMIRCVNRRDTRWIATWRRLSASWTPNQPQRPKQEENAATMGEKKVNGRKRQFWVDTNGAGAHYHMRAKRTCLSVTTTWSYSMPRASSYTEKTSCFCARNHCATAGPVHSSTRKRIYVGSNNGTNVVFARDFVANNKHA
jgi:hypothetical protein